MRQAFTTSMCEYDTEAELLADLPPSATLGFALDTYNPWLYWPNRGWFPIMPYKALQGQQLTSQLDPSVPTFDPLAITGPITSPPGLGPLTYHSVVTETIPGQWLDVQGFIRFYLCGVYDNTTGGPQSFAARVIGDDGVEHIWGDVSADPTPAGNTEQFELRGVVGNVDSLSSQGGCGTVTIGQDGSSSPGITIFKMSGSVDTMLPFDLKIKIFSGTGAPPVTVTKAIVEVFSSDA